MPMLTVTIAATPDADRSRRIAEGLTAITARVLRKDPAVTAIALSHVAPDHWFVGARSVGAEGRTAFWLEIGVTAGTNTKDEKAAYLRDVYAFMAEVLGPLSEKSYALVNEVSADSYGYAGVTQEHRYIAARLAA